VMPVVLPKSKPMWNDEPGNATNAQKIENQRLLKQEPETWAPAHWVKATAGKCVINSFA
jgi:hypothetical protein